MPPSGARGSPLGGAGPGQAGPGIGIGNWNQDEKMGLMEV